MKTKACCAKVHFTRIVLSHTDVSLGDCSYLDTCRHTRTCKFVHYVIDKSTIDRVHHGKSAVKAGEMGDKEDEDDDAIAAGVKIQWVNCDIRTFDMSVLGKFDVIMTDPPWDIHMELPYGTMSDNEMRAMPVRELQDDGLIFLWVTGRALELARELLDLWGYRRIEEILWIKTNQLQVWEGGRGEQDVD